MADSAKKQALGAMALLAMVITGRTALAAPAITNEVNAVYAGAESLYIDLHRHPELSGHEEQTAARMAAGLRDLGFEVTTGVGRTGVVGILRNGPGKTVMLRTELDALPVEEKTGLPFASTVRTKDDKGADVGVMHACGHDIHMSSWLTTARIMANSRKTWHGTLVMIGQPAEEAGGGAQWMIDDGLFKRFPKPDAALAIHDDARQLAGVVGYHAGPILSHADFFSITIYGVGGHGARPETTIDPVVIAARTVMGLQSIVAREISPFEPAVVTIGSIHGGSKNNIIPAEVRLEGTSRSFTDEVKAHLRRSIERTVKGEALAAGAPKEPAIEWLTGAYALVNDTALTQKVSAALLREIGPEQVKDVPPEMVSEDFSDYQRAGVPVVMLRIGATEKSVLETAKKAGTDPPSLHSALFAPDREKTIKAAVAAEVVSLRELLK